MRRKRNMARADPSLLPSSPSFGLLSATCHLPCSATHRRFTPYCTTTRNRRSLCSTFSVQINHERCQNSGGGEGTAGGTSRAVSRESVRPFFLNTGCSLIVSVNYLLNPSIPFPLQESNENSVVLIKSAKICSDDVGHDDDDGVCEL